MPPQNDEERLFVKRIAELARTVEARGGTRWTLFCTDREQALAEAALAKAGGVQFCWDGGWPQAERRMLCIYDGAASEAPLTALRIAVQFQHGRSLTHRDYLGSLMGLGIKRESLGDILPDENVAVVFTALAAGKLIMQELSQIGSCAVNVRLCEAGETLSERAEPEKQRATVASLRADSVLAAMLHLSRSEAARLIAAHAVSVNHVEISSPHFEVNEADVFSVKGKGKYKLCGIEGKSRKDRLFISFLPY